MRYLLIDRITEFEANRKIRAIKAVSGSEDFFREHFPGNPVMPGALMIEAAAQAATALIELSANCTVKGFLILVHEAKFRALVRPGETLVFSLEIESADKEFARLNCEVTSCIPGAKPTKAAQMNLTLGIRPVSEFYSEHTQRFVRTMYDDLLRGATIIGNGVSKISGEELL